MVEPVWAVENDRKTLLRIMASLVKMAGAGASVFTSPLQGGGRREASGGGAAPSVEGRTTLPRFLYRTILKLLRPAEYAARRLLIAFSRDIKLPPPIPRPQKPLPIIRDSFGNPIVLPDGVRISGHLFRTKPIRTSGSSGKIASGSPRKLTLPLFDPLPRFDGRPIVIRTAQPRIWVAGVTDRRPIPPRPKPTDPIDATRLWLRIDAVVAALTDFEAHATRYARWRERTKQALAQGKSVKRTQPLRPGRLPGGGSARTREVHDLLKHTQQFAYYALVYPDDS